jgi:OmpA-OmpF porin, OOP family
VSIGARLGAHRTRKPARPPVLEVVEPPKPPEPDPDLDRDGDGIPDRLDQCPLVPEWVNGIDDDDGCPEPDPDGDGIVGAMDKCPDLAEDFDQFEDDDGCPDNDNDQDGIPDVSDSCPLQPETMNGFADQDGCPDEVPAAVLAALGAAKAVKFEPGKVRLTSASKTALDKALPQMLSNKTVKFTITAHPEAAGDPAAELARKRADAVKFYLSEQGVAAGNLTAVVGPPLADKKSPVVVLSVTP